MTATTKMEVDLAKNEIVFTRIINAPRTLVFKAWTDPKQMSEWWGPHTFTVPVCEMDVRPGGTYRIVMRSPEGVEYPLKGVYREIVEPERLVYTQDLAEVPAEWKGRAQVRPGIPHDSQIRRARRKDEAHDPDPLRLGRGSRRDAEDADGRGMGGKPGTPRGTLGESLTMGGGWKDLFRGDPAIPATSTIQQELYAASLVLSLPHPACGHPLPRGEGVIILEFTLPSPQRGEGQGVRGQAQRPAPMRN